MNVPFLESVWPQTQGGFWKLFPQQRSWTSSPRIEYNIVFPKQSYTVYFLEFELIAKAINQENYTKSNFCILLKKVICEHRLPFLPGNHYQALNSSCLLLRAHSLSCWPVSAHPVTPHILAECQLHFSYCKIKIQVNYVSYWSSIKKWDETLLRITFFSSHPAHS